MWFAVILIRLGIKDDGGRTYPKNARLAACIYSLNNYLLSTYFVPDTSLEAGDSLAKLTPSLCRTCILVKERAINR